MDDGLLPKRSGERACPGLLAAQEREGKPIALEGVIVKGAMWGDGGSRLSVVLRYDPEDFGLSASPEVKHADSRPRTGLPVTTFSDPFKPDHGREPDGRALGWGSRLCRATHEVPGVLPPECASLPEVMERLDFTRMTSAARARMKDKFGAAD